MKKLLLATLLLGALLHADSFTNSIGMTFVEIPSGSYMMGTKPPKCPKDDPFTSTNEYKDCMNNIVEEDELPYHKVRIKSFYMATTEVTQLQWYRVMGNNPANFKKEELGYDSRNNPVENVSWYDAKKFVEKLNKLEHTNKYRLSTEEEWEYAARAGSSGKWCFGDDESKLGQYAWYGDNSRNRTHPVAQKKPNRWGLYDMHGNVWEWVSSCHTKTYDSGCYQDHKVLRGGSWYISTNCSRSAYRNSNRPGFRYYNIGFRLARTK